jgi:hypothetical protein
MLAWPWIAASGLLLAAVRLPESALLRYWQIPLYSSPLLPAVVSLALGCLLTICDKVGHPDSPSPMSSL